MRRLFGCPDIVSLTEKFLMARNFYRIFTENKPVMGDSKTFGIPEAKGLNQPVTVSAYCIVRRVKNALMLFLILKWNMVLSITESSQKYLTTH